MVKRLKIKLKINVKSIILLFYKWKILKEYVIINLGVRKMIFKGL